MADDKNVVLLRSGNRLVISPTTDKIRGIVCPLLTYIEKKFHRGREAAIARKSGHLPFTEQVWECYIDDVKDRIGTSFGFHENIVSVLEANGYSVTTRYSSKMERQIVAERNETVYKPRWDRIDEFLKTGFKYRLKQDLALQLMAQHECGRINCPPGWGKGTSILLACILFPKAKIDVAVDSVAILHQRLYPELSANLPSVGLVGGGKRIMGCRVMCYNADSLHHARPDADFVFVDEGHQAAADKFAANLAQFEHARMWAFSASWDMRLDNKDMRSEAAFGPIRMTVTYQEAEEAGIVVPMEVQCTDVVMDEDPCEDIDNDTDWKRAAYWRNEVRNELIAKDARSYGDDVQVLIPVETLEHALALKQKLPEFKLVYSPSSNSDFAYLQSEGLLPENFQIITEERKAKRTRMFTKGKLKKVIVTTVWNAGVDFRHLEVLIRADGGGSAINDVQIPGRNSRTNKALMKYGKPVTKRVGIIRDYNDVFNEKAEGRSNRRKNNYKKNGWKIHEIASNRRRKHVDYSDYIGGGDG